MPRSTSTINTCYITALYNFPLWLASHPVGQWVSHLSSSRPACLAPLWQPSSRAYMYVCCSPGQDLAISSLTMAGTWLYGPTQQLRYNFLKVYYSIQYWSAWQILVMSYFWPWRFYMVVWLLTPSLPGYSEKKRPIDLLVCLLPLVLGSSTEHMWSLYIYTCDL